MHVSPTSCRPVKRSSGVAMPHGDCAIDRCAADPGLDFATQAPPLLYFFGGFFLAIGLYLVVGRFFVDAYLRGTMTYVVIDRAAYIARAGRFTTARRFTGSALDVVERKLQRDDSGTIQFVNETLSSGSQQNGSNWST